MNREQEALRSIQNEIHAKYKKELAQANEKIKRVEEAFKWCLENESECEGTKYEDDAVFDNWNKMKRVLSELEVNNEDV